MPVNNFAVLVLVVTPEHKAVPTGWPYVSHRITLDIQDYFEGIVATRVSRSNIPGSRYVGALRSIWLFLFPIFFFSAQPKDFFLWVKEVRTTKS
jgi:hypothetical protein